jgi:hypothetical protein
MDTSSIVRGLTIGGLTPAGMRSKLACSFWLSRMSAASISVPTVKRTMTSDCPGLEVE